jgi:hypothetical protein
MELIRFTIMKTKKRFITVFILTIGIILQFHVVNSQPLADKPAPEFDYVQEVAEGKFVFVMLSIEEDPTAYGQGGAVQNEDIRRQYPQSGLYKNDGSITPVWAVDWYAFEVAISSDGRYLVRWGPWPFHGEYDELAVAFYKNGREIRRYAVRDLVADPESLPRSISHYMWAKERSFDATTNLLHIETYNGEQYDVDVTTGKKLTRSNFPQSGFVILGAIGILIFVGTFLLLMRYRNRL